MSRRGGKRREVLQLSAKNSKLHRYGYSKQLHSGDVPKLVSDYPTSESEEEEQPLHEQNGTDPVSEIEQQQQMGESESGPGHMDDELRNFLSEIEAIPLPPENGQPPPAPSQAEAADEAPTPPELESPPTSAAASREASPAPREEKANQYSMFVRGATEFAHSPSAPVEEEEEAGKADGTERVDLSQLPEEPVSLWQMVQDDSSQYMYYWNTQTNQVTWEIPSEYTQYLLLHQEYQDRVAKLTPGQQKALEERKARMAAVAMSLPASGTEPQVQEVREKGDAKPTQHRERHKKKKKKHKRNYSDDSEDEDRSQHKREIGPAPKPASPEPAAVATAPPALAASSLLGIADYGSDHDEDEEEEKDLESEAPKELFPHSRASSPGSGGEEDDMPPHLSPAETPLGPAPSDSSVSLPSLQAVESEDNITKADSPSVQSGEDREPTLTPDSAVRENKEEVGPKFKQAEPPENKPLEKPKAPEVRKKKKVIDMFAEEDFPSEESADETKPPPAQPEVEEEPSQEEVKLEEKTVKEESMPSESPAQAVLADKTKQAEEKKSSVQIVASYSTDGDGEEEEGEKKEPIVIKPKKKKKEKKEKRTRGSRSPLSHSGSHPVDGQLFVGPKLKEDFVGPTSTESTREEASAVHPEVNVAKVKAESDSVSRSPKPKGAASVEQSGVSQSGPPTPSDSTVRPVEPMEVTPDPTGVDIDPDDLDDIDRALERALEEKLERKMNELDSYAKTETATSGSPDVPVDAVASKENPSTTATPDPDALKREVLAKAELALSKLEFLDITTDSLSRLQVLLIELQTRLTDWQDGGLSTEYFLQQLGVAESLLEQYEASAVPEGWACQWDRAHNRYFYRHVASDRIQWEYPEPDKGDNSHHTAPVEEDRKSSRSSRHRSKREEKERSSKRDKHSSSGSRRHRRKRHRHREASSSSEESATTTSRHRHRKSKTGDGDSSEEERRSSRHRHSKKKKRRRSQARSPSVELVGREDPKTVVIPDEDEEEEPSSSPKPEGQADMATPPRLEGSSPPPESPPSPPPPGTSASPSTPLPAGSDQPLEREPRPAGPAQEGTGGGGEEDEEEDVDGEAMEEEEEEGEKVEEVNTAVICKPPQIIRAPEIIAAAPVPLVAGPVLTPQPEPTTTTPTTVAASSPASKPETADLEPSEKASKKKKKDKKSGSGGSSMLMKKKQMSSMVQKWQKVKKEVEKEDRDKELHQAAIRQKINQLK